jgi:hypothetical protein
VVIDDDPSPISISVHECKSRGVCHTLPISGISERVDSAVNRYIAEDPNMLFGDGDPRIGAFARILEIVRNRCRRLI